MGIAENPISIQIQKDFNASLTSKLSNQKARDWKLSIPELKPGIVLSDRNAVSNDVQKDLQQVLDLISPLKSPVRRDLDQGVDIS